MPSTPSTVFAVSEVLDECFISNFCVYQSGISSLEPYHLSKNNAVSPYGNARSLRNRSQSAAPERTLSTIWTIKSSYINFLFRQWFQLIEVKPLITRLVGSISCPMSARVPIVNFLWLQSYSLFNFTAENLVGREKRSFWIRNIQWNDPVDTDCSHLSPDFAKNADRSVLCFRKYLQIASISCLAIWFQVSIIATKSKR